MPTVAAFIRTAGHIAGALIDAAFDNLPEAYYESQCNAIKAGIYVQ